MYAKKLTINKGVDNVILFEFVNQDQKPVNITGSELRFKLINLTGTAQLIEKDMVIINAQYGRAKVTLTSAETSEFPPEHLTATYDRSTWSLPVEMEFMAKMGGVPQADMERTWNCGIGMSAFVDPAVADLTLRSLAARGMKAWVAGVVTERKGSDPRSTLEGSYQAR